MKDKRDICMSAISSLFAVSSKDSNRRCNRTPFSQWQAGRQGRADHLERLWFGGAKDLIRAFWSLIMPILPIQVCLALSGMQHAESRPATSVICRRFIQTLTWSGVNLTFFSGLWGRNT